MPLIAAPKPPGGITAQDESWDGGEEIDVVIQLSPDDVPAQAKPDDDSDEDESKPATNYIVYRAVEENGLYTEVARATADEDAYENKKVTVTVTGLTRGQEYWFRAKALGPDDETSDFVQTKNSATPQREILDGGRAWLGLILVIVCGSVIMFIAMARSGIELKVRKIAGLEAVDEAVGRATEMGRSCLFIPGIQDMNDIQTIAGITILSHVAKLTAEYDAAIEVPTSRALVMTTARETVQSSYLAAGRPDSYNEDSIYYVTDEQFGYVAYLSGMMVREKPAACFYLGSFFAESLILAETGNSIGAIQVAGTAQPAQLPFFVAACDYTLIGEEFFAASAYLSGDPDQLGSLKGQDVGKLIVAGLLVLGCFLLTLTDVVDVELFADAAHYLTDTILR